MELTKQELKLAVFAATQYRNFFWRNNQLFGYIGLVPFFLGFEVFPLPEWLRNVFMTVGFIMVISSAFGFFVSTTGKLYAQLQVLRRQAGGTAT
jgi:uncharacterized membrane protein YesL